MKTVLGMTLLVTLMSPLALTGANDSDYEKRGKVEIKRCDSISDSCGRELCDSRRKLRILRRAITDILTIGDGGTSEGGASDCAQAAEDACLDEMLPSEVDTLDYDSSTGICIWSCKVISS